MRTVVYGNTMSTTSYAKACEMGIEKEMHLEKVAPTTPNLSPKRKAMLEKYGKVAKGLEI